MRRRRCGVVVCTAVVCFQLVVVVGAAAADDELAGVSARPPLIEDAIPGVPTVAARLAEIHRRVQSAARYPAIAQSRSVEGETLVAFEIERGGRAFDIETSASSGSGALDRAALLAVEDAGPLPWVYGRVVVPVRFELLDAE
jgi:TonB family protein